MCEYTRYKMRWKWVQRPTSYFRVEVLLQNALQNMMARSCDKFIGHRIIGILNSAQTDHLSHISKTPSIIALRMYRDSPLKKIQTMRSVVFCFQMRRRAIEVYLFRVVPNYILRVTPFSKVKFPSILSMHFLHNCWPPLVEFASGSRKLRCNVGRRRRVQENKGIVH